MWLQKHIWASVCWPSYLPHCNRLCAEQRNTQMYIKDLTPIFNSKYLKKKIARSFKKKIWTEYFTCCFRYMSHFIQFVFSSWIQTFIAQTCPLEAYFIFRDKNFTVKDSGFTFKHTECIFIDRNCMFKDIILHSHAFTHTAVVINLITH